MSDDGEMIMEQLYPETMILIDSVSEGKILHEKRTIQPNSTRILYLILSIFLQSILIAIF